MANAGRNSRKVVLTGLTGELDWSRLLAAAPDSAKFVGFVSDAPELDPEKAEDVEFIEKMRQFFLMRQAVTEWPGTRSRNQASRYLYEFDERMARLLAEYWAGRGWGDGIDARDLHILHEDGTLWLASTRCDDSWWVGLDPSDQERLLTLSEVGGATDLRPEVHVEYAKVWLDLAALGHRPTWVDTGGSSDPE